MRQRKNARSDKGPGREDKQRLTLGPARLLREVCGTNGLRSMWLWLPGQPPRKSNQRRIGQVRRKGGKGTRPIVRLSAEAQTWVEAILKTMPAAAKADLGAADRTLGATFVCWYRTHQPDLSVELVLDVLQKSGVIADDRYVFSTYAIKVVDDDLQGVLVYLYPLEEEAMAQKAYDMLEAYYGSEERQEERQTEKL